MNWLEDLKVKAKQAVEQGKISAEKASEWIDQKIDQVNKSKAMQNIDTDEQETEWAQKFHGKKSFKQIGSNMKTAQRSILEEDREVQESIDLLEQFYNVVGQKSREIGDRWKTRTEQVDISPIPDYSKKQQIEEKDLKDAFDLTKQQIIESLLKQIKVEQDEGKVTNRLKMYIEQFANIQDPKQLLDLYHTFVQRYSTDAQNIYQQEKKSKTDRNWIQDNHPEFLEKYNKYDDEFRKNLIKILKKTTGSLEQRIKQKRALESLEWGWNQKIKKLKQVAKLEKAIKLADHFDKKQQYNKADQIDNIINNISKKVKKE